MNGKDGKTMYEVISGKGKAFKSDGKHLLPVDKGNLHSPVYKRIVLEFVCFDRVLINTWHQNDDKVLAYRNFLRTILR